VVELEDRVVLSTLLVTSAADSGTGTLRARVGAAHSGDTIEFSSSLMGQTITLTSGEIVIPKNLTINGQANMITVSGGSNSRIFEVVMGTATIEQLTLSKGLVSGGNGGAVIVDSGAGLTLTHDTLSNNEADQDSMGNFGFGGAVENDGALKIAGSTFQTNTSQSAGGAIDSFSGSGGTLTVTGTKFFGNTSGSFGGAISTADTTTLTGDTFGATGSGQPNTATSGSGAVDAFGSIPGTTQLTITKCTFTDNSVTGSSGFGGAISTTDILSATFSNFTGNSTPFGGGAIDYFIRNSTSTGFTSSMTLADDTFISNSGEGGGAVFSNVKIASGSATVSITDCTFWKNTATGSPSFVFGGGLDVFHTTAGTGSASATIVNDTFFQNTSTNHGGGLAVTDTNTGTGTNTAALTSLTVYKNTAATDGGGLYISGGSVSVDNSILDGNTVTASGYTGPEDLTVASGGTLTDLGFNLVGTTDTQFSLSSDILHNNPGLTNTLNHNGAPAGVPKTLALNTTSVGHDTGDQSLAGMSGVLGQDERGFTRQSGKVSIGAEDPDSLA
jgi:predicted outer membrane repeat protein